VPNRFEGLKLALFGHSVRQKASRWAIKAKLIIA
jgi:hypothetical protein